MKTFTELELKPALMKAITDLKYETPSAIQAQALPILLGEPTDFIGLAATGTGKTAAFSIPMLEQIDPAFKQVQALVLCPTRELALQVSGQINILGKHLKIHALPIYGGSGYGDQIRGLKEGVNIVVGTPGRLIDHLEKGTLSLSYLKTLILDEADEMISMGFKDELEAILKAAPHETSNIWLFSATMDREIRRMADKYLKKPKQVQVNKTEMLSTTVEQIYYLTNEQKKPEVLLRLIDAAPDFYGIVFCQTKQLVTDLTRYLMERGYQVDCLHGDKDQASRERTMNAFRERKAKILICTDVASRGLDVKDITHVINYSLPRELDNYVHRIGRTARSGKSGFAMSLVTPMHRSLIQRIEKMTNSRMTQGTIPSHEEIFQKKVGETLALFKTQAAFGRAVQHMGKEWKETVADMKPEEIAARFLMICFPEVFKPVDEVLELQRSTPVVPPREDRGSYRNTRHPMRQERSGGGRPDYQSHKKAGAPSARPQGDRLYGGKAYGNKPYAKPYGDKPYGAKPYSGKPYPGKSYPSKGVSGAPGSGALGSGGKPQEGKPYTKPFNDKPYSDKPKGRKLYPVKSHRGQGPAASAQKSTKAAPKAPAAESSSGKVKPQAPWFARKTKDHKKNKEA